MDHARIERISKALSDKTRLRIFEAISSREEMNCGEIVSMRGVTPATVSHHLRVLSEAGLIECRREGQFIYNTVKTKALQSYIRALTELSRKHKK